MDGALTQPAPRLLLPVLCFIVMNVAVLQTAVVPIIGAIGTQLDVGPTAVGWVLTANLLAAAVTTPVLGRLADLRGKRSVLVGVLAVVLLGSVLAAAAESLPLLIAGRMLQGVSFALFPIGIAILRDELPPDRLVGAMGIFSGTLGVGGGIGMVITGLLVADGADYRRVFWVVAAVGAVALALALVSVPSRPRSTTGTIDWLGALLLGVGLALVLLALSDGNEWGWSSPATVGCAVAGVLVLAGWFAFEHRAADPLIPPRMLTHRPVLLANLIALVVGMAMFVSFLAGSYFVQTPREVAGYGFGATVLQASAVYLLPGALIGVLAAAASGRLIHRFDARKLLIAASGLGLAGFVLVIVAHDRTWQVIVSMIMVNVFISLAYAALPALLVAEVKQSETGVANSLNSIARTVGSSLASALVASLLAGLTVTETGVTREAAYVIAFAVGAVAAGSACLLAMFGSGEPVRALSEREEREVEATALAAEWGTVGGLSADNALGAAAAAGRPAPVTSCGAAAESTSETVRDR